MGLLLQIVGVIITIASLIYSIVAIVNGTSSSIAIILLVAGGLVCLPHFTAAEPHTL